MASNKFQVRLDPIIYSFTSPINYQYFSIINPQLIKATACLYVLISYIYIYDVK